MSSTLLPDLLGRTFYHNSLHTWLMFGIAILVDVAVLLLLRYVIIRRLSSLAARTPTMLDDLLVDLLRRTRFIFVLFVALWAAARLLTLPDGASKTVHDVAVIILLLQVGIWVNTGIGFWVHRFTTQRNVEGTSITTIIALGFVARLLLWAVLVLLALENLGVNVTAVVAGLGITGIAVALALQNILSDLFAALSIVLDKPFVVGDNILVDQFAGDVEYIGLKTTRLRSVSGEQIIFSNADLLRSRIRNFKRMSRRRVLFSVGVEYDTPPEQLERIPTLLREAVEAHEQVTLDRSHLVRLGASSIDFETVYFVESADYPTHMAIQQAVHLTVLRRFRDEGIGIAYPTQRILRASAEGSEDGARSEGAAGSANARRG
jgi:small-conductance mechanosensitive channel